MLTFINHSSIELKLLGFFFSHSESPIYLRELSRQLKHPAGSLQRPLARLEKQGILKATREGMLKYFSLNPDYPYFPELQSMVLRENRRLILEKDLKKIVARLKKNYNPSKIVLFGSTASGRVSPHGDLDLLIVKKNIPDRYWERVREVAPFLADSHVGVDFVVWKPEELQAEMGKNLFLKNEILAKGRILYERSP